MIEPMILLFSRETLFSPSEFLDIHNTNTIIIVIHTLTCIVKNCLMNFEKNKKFIKNSENDVIFFVINLLCSL